MKATKSNTMFRIICEDGLSFYEKYYSILQVESAGINPKDGKVMVLVELEENQREDDE